MQMITTSTSLKENNLAGICGATIEPWRQRVFGNTRGILWLFLVFQVQPSHTRRACTTGFQPFIQATYNLTLLTPNIHDISGSSTVIVVENAGYQFYNYEGCTMYQ